ncbi:hypothetical protein FPV67DRAFT_932411 [Lyophyllum atratum]|nr:hypothetical protein FPV67DRAFT_932411 [Lyophyllum atratum]
MMEKVLNNAPKRNFEKDERTLEKLQKYRDKQIVREATYKCIACGSLGNPDLKKCSGCREVMYCSKECQRLDWEAHKRNCRKPRSCCRVV